MMKLFSCLLDLLFPPKCVLCRCFLSREETDICHRCRQNTPEPEKSKFRLSFVAGWTGLWYYKDDVRNSLIRYKFNGLRCYGPVYGRALAMHLRQKGFAETDVLTFVPVAPLRRLSRGYDQVELLSDAVGKELGIPSVRTLRKIRNTPPQSGFKDISRRRANVLGVYAITDPNLVRGKRILLLDDVITTGATASECARVLLTAGAKEVFCAAIAVANHDK
ncbi:MAG: ComF family protein [Oscillospiraceae bacterium]|nr:ComF family protein [Oscillospiraceae bacterium]